jgi:glycerol-3-phosphate dehydrogenase
VTQRYDVVIVGGGIHGVGVAQAAAAGGHTTLLIEQGVLAGGTSSRSSKLIHGGLRYLESGRIGLVRESLRERALLLRLAPELVQLRPFFFPVYRTTRRRPWQVRAGLSLYAALGGLSDDTRFQRVPRDEWSGLDGLNTDGLQVVFRYQDAQTDDAALTRAVMRSAQALGAKLAMPASFTAAKLTRDGCEVEYRSDGATHTCNTQVLVNAAGPWGRSVLDRIEPATTARAVELVQGAHLVVRGVIASGIYYVEAARDGRAVFVMPWQGDTLVGTTETPFDGDPADVRVLPGEQAYLLDVLHQYFPRYADAEIIDSFAGLRVLPVGREPAFRRSRETILHADRADRPRLVTMYGGKLTTYRSTAEKVMNLVASSLPDSRRVADTRTLELTDS